MRKRVGAVGWTYKYDILGSFLAKCGDGTQFLCDLPVDLTQTAPVRIASLPITSRSYVARSLDFGSPKVVEPIKPYQ